MKNMNLEESTALALEGKLEEQRDLLPERKSELYSAMLDYLIELEDEYTVEDIFDMSVEDLYESEESLFDELVDYLNEYIDNADDFAEAFNMTEEELDILGIK